MLVLLAVALTSFGVASQPAVALVHAPETPIVDQEGDGA